jgi:hypothetical protein
VKAEVPFSSPDDVPFRRAHRRTGRSKSEALKGNAYRLVHGLRAKDHVKRRAAFMQLLRETRAAVAKARSIERS